MNKYSSTFLLPNNGIIIGAGSILNFSGTYIEFNTSNSAEEADSKAIENDFGMVGNDIRESIINFSNEEKIDVKAQ